ncbi:hypothetical protein DFH09DRAFT_1368806 [Mycena vulgaris]|nr:hypothetical protein DFH09DRAFT_1368806 [Mycena vulgaris]
MDDGPPVEAEFHSESSLDEDGPRNDQYTGAFFPGGQNFVVAGGRFKSITNITYAAPTVPSDFRMIPMGDLDLREEIRPRHRSGLVFRGKGRASVRRVYSARIHGSKSKMTVAVYQGENAEESWLAQANYLFNRLGITSNYDDYVYVHQINYQVTLSGTGRIPPGYLFLCPLRELKSEIPSHFRFPECPAYWSLDPSGAERLSTEEADELGFPRLEFEMLVWEDSWDESVYTGIRQFHQAKGYDPYSRDVARELGCLLYEVASQLELFEETESCSGDEDSEQDGGLPSNEVDEEPGKDSSLVEGIHPLLDEAELLEPSRTWKIVMALQAAGHHLGTTSSKLCFTPHLVFDSPGPRYRSIKLTHPCFVGITHPSPSRFSHSFNLSLSLTLALSVNVHISGASESGRRASSSSDLIPLPSLTLTFDENSTLAVGRSVDSALPKPLRSLSPPCPPHPSGPLADGGTQGWLQFINHHCVAEREAIAVWRAAPSALSQKRVAHPHHPRSRHSSRAALHLIPGSARAHRGNSTSISTSCLRSPRGRGSVVVVPARADSRHMRWGACLRAASVAAQCGAPTGPALTVSGGAIGVILRAGATVYVLRRKMGRVESRTILGNRDLGVDNARQWEGPGVEITETCFFSQAARLTVFESIFADLEERYRRTVKKDFEFSATWPSFEARFHSESMTDVDGPPEDQSMGAFFPQAQHFVVAGGKFKSITYTTHSAPTVSSDFRMIPMGDLDLREEIRPQHRSGVVFREKGRVSVKRVYSARIHGSKAKMTVAVYQGKNAEKKWREDISRYSWLLHPNVVQLYATASRSGIHAAGFHDELIPATQIMKAYRGSPLRTVYLYHYLDTELNDVRRYMYSVLGTSLHSSECMMWIRCSTGRLCVDLTRPEFDPLFLSAVQFILPPSAASSTSEPPENSQIIESTPLNMYHEICALHLGHSLDFPISPHASVQLGAIIACAAGTGIEDLTMIAGIPDDMFQDSGWWFPGDREPLVMADGWTRASSSGIRDKQIHRTIDSNRFAGQSEEWLAQANCIFNRLGITSSYDNYVYVDYIQYQLTLSDTGSVPPGYLFLRDFESEIPSHFRLPACPAYWSLDPSGGERLSAEEADELGFPGLELKMEVRGWSWDESVYTGIRQFHEGKGYDPYSQDVARELGYPIFRLSSELESVQETESCRGNEDSEQDDRLSNTEGDGESGADSWLVKGIRTRIDEAELLEPSRTWNIVMAVQITLILPLSVLCLMSYSPVQPTSLNT